MHAEAAVVPPPSAVNSTWLRLKPPVIAILIASVTMIFTATWAWMSCGSIERAVGYYLRGRTLILDSDEKSFDAIGSASAQYGDFQVDESRF